MSDEILKILRELIENKMGKYKFPLDRNIMLEKNLGMTGDDAVEFLLDYSKKCNVDLSGFNINEYFGPEGDSILPGIIRFFTGKKKPKHKELTLGDLEKGVIAGRLDEEVINGTAS